MIAAAVTPVREPGMQALVDAMTAADIGAVPATAKAVDPAPFSNRSLSKKE
jgi:hypothetical protein